MEVPEGWGSKAKVPSGGGGEGVWIFSGTTPSEQVFSSKGVGK